jgi:hypothetical protein
VTDLASGNLTVPTLIVTGGPLDGTMFEVDDSSRDRLLGSSTDCDLQLLLGNVDPVHAKVARGPRGLLLSDGGSGTGTYVNGEKIDTDYLLQDGDRICLGPPGSKSSAKLLVRLPAAGAALPLDAAAGSAASPFSAGGDKPLSLVAPETALEAHAPPPFVPPSRGEMETMALPRVSRPPASVPFIPPPPPPMAAPPPPPPPPMAAPHPAPPPPPPPPLSATPARTAKPEYHDGLASGFESARDADLAAEPLRALPEKPTPKPVSRSPLRAGPATTVSPAVLLGLLAFVALGGAFYAMKYVWKKPPVLTAVLPGKTEPGQTVSLSGKQFASDAAANVVRFGDYTGQVSSASDTQLTVAVPAVLAATGPVEVPVTIETSGGRSKAVTLKVYRAPKVTSVTPDVVMPGQEIIVSGENLSGTPLSVAVGGMIAEVKEAQADRLRVLVPKIPVVEGHKAVVSIQVGPDTAKPGEVILGRLPLVLGASPDRGYAGDRVAIRGRGFDAKPSGNLVTFSGQPALVLAATATELTVAAPAADSSSETEVVVKANGASSTSSARFVPLRLSSGVFTPRFFAAPVTEYPTDNLAFVSTELGPVLLMGDPGDAPSAAERAARTAAILNQLVDGAGKQPPAFEIRERPDLGVGIVGTPAPLLTATAGDAAAYSRAWESPGKGGRRATTRGVATQWAALLQDYFSLFVLKQRPLKVLELTPRGKVLSDLYADGLRQAEPGGGVPTRVVRPLTTTMAKAIREMALVIPDQPARAAVAVEGRWVGSLVEGGPGGRPFEVRLRSEGTKLAGSLTTKAGSLEMRAPLRDVAYEKGTLRFVVDLAGSPRLFSGAMKADTIEGSISKTTGDKAAVGTFTLKYAE